jgi:L-ascorbate metabolism protein UlaG (beta-lactamase superfamily)
MLVAAIIIAVIVLSVVTFLNHERFGSAPSGERLQRVRHSPNYRDGRFHNLSFTPNFKEGVNGFKVMKDFFFNKSKRAKPATTLPNTKTDLQHLDPLENILVWFGHSSYFLQVDGKKILVDPVLSGHASPVKFTTKSFAGTDVYTPADIPFIDYLFISHDHWDHLDYRTIINLRGKIGKIITGLGVAAHLEKWGFDKEIIFEKDWNEDLDLGDSFKVRTTAARHFSGRSLKRNNTLWLSFVLFTPTMKLFLGGDSGYDSHFKEIGKQHGPFDLAILECGQYNEYWKYIHMMPEEVVQASLDLKAEKLLPVHWSKFSLSLHAWDEPIQRIVAEAKKKGVTILHPLIGEKVNLVTAHPSKEWWKEVDQTNTKGNK